MFCKARAVLLLISLLPLLVSARNHLSGCVYTVTSRYAYWIDPCSGEICTTYDASDSLTQYLTGYTAVPIQYYSSCNNKVLTVAQTATTEIMPVSRSSSNPSAGPYTLTVTPTLTLSSNVTSSTSSMITVAPIEPILPPNPGPTPTSTESPTTTSTEPIIPPIYTGAAATIKAANFIGVVAGAVAGAVLL